MIKIITYLLFVLFAQYTYCQETKAVMDKYEKAKTTDDKFVVIFGYVYALKDTLEQRFDLSNNLYNQFKEKNDLTGMGVVQIVMGSLYYQHNDYVSALKYNISGLKNFEETKDTAGIIQCCNNMAVVFTNSQNYEQGLFYFKKINSLIDTIHNRMNYGLFQNSIADCYIKMKHPDSAIAYSHTAIRIGEEQKDTTNLSYDIGTLGELYLTRKDYDIAKPFLIKASLYGKKLNDSSLLAPLANDLSNMYFNKLMYDSSIEYARQAVSISNAELILIDAYQWLYKSFDKMKNSDSASKYFRLFVDAKDSLFSAEKNKNIQSLNFEEQLSEKEKEQALIAAKKDFHSRLLLFIAFGVVIIILLITIFLYRNNMQQKKAKLQIEKAYSELKSTQQQLIQSEKMASLGELTAGIAHEIQNPLNFVNNFSEVNEELLTEVKDEMQKGNYDDAKEIIEDIISNEEKINHHGKRADAIVKGMLQHSRTTSATKEPTDINNLADEYLRLTFHGMRAKDKEFNATINTDFDESIGSINIISQDISRVLLNLYNNAFYALNEKQKTYKVSQDLIGLEAYQPTVSVSTKKIGNSVTISVSDNGNGIPSNIIDKIFQPFFTTKPTGLGTGLGLSLSYDIIKAHGGELKVETKEGEGSTFIIQLPTIIN